MSKLIQILAGFFAAIIISNTAFAQDFPIYDYWPAGHSLAAPTADRPGCSVFAAVTEEVANPFNSAEKVSRVSTGDATTLIQTLDSTCPPDSAGCPVTSLDVFLPGPRPLDPNVSVDPAHPVGLVCKTGFSCGGRITDLTGNVIALAPATVNPDIHRLDYGCVPDCINGCCSPKAIINGICQQQGCPGGCPAGQKCTYRTVKPEASCANEGTQTLFLCEAANAVDQDGAVIDHTDTTENNDSPVSQVPRPGGTGTQPQIIDIMPLPSTDLTCPSQCPVTKTAWSSLSTSAQGKIKNCCRRMTTRESLKSGIGSNLFNGVCASCSNNVIDPGAVDQCSMTVGGRASASRAGLICPRVANPRDNTPGSTTPAKDCNPCGGRTPCLTCMAFNPSCQGTQCTNNPPQNTQNCPRGTSLTCSALGRCNCTGGTPISPAPSPGEPPVSCRIAFDGTSSCNTVCRGPGCTGGGSGGTWHPGVSRKWLKLKNAIGGGGGGGGGSKVVWPGQWGPSKGCFTNGLCIKTYPANPDAPIMKVPMANRCGRPGENCGKKPIDPFTPAAPNNPVPPVPSPSSSSSSGAAPDAF